MIITNISIRNRTTVFVLAAAIVISGVFCYMALPREAAPDVQIPIVVVNTSYRGVAPADIETSVTMEIEKKLKGISGVKEIRSTSSEGLSSITVEFEPNLDIETALQKVRDKVDQAKGELPSEAEEPEIIEVNVSEFPILIINLHGDASLVKLKEIADDVKDEIEQVSGVLEANVLGGLEREIRIEVDPDRMAAYKIPIVDLVTLVERENVNVSAGSIDTPDSKFTVRVPGEFIDPREIETLVVTTVDGRPIYLTDVARVTDAFKDVTSISRVNGKECVSISVQKRAGENIIRITDEVKDILDRWKGQLGGAIAMEISLDFAKIIRQMVHDLENNILSGFILVAAVVFIALGRRNAVFVSIAIPLSMFIAFSVLVALEITLNFVTLFALTLALGMLVDNAIVIVENIYRHMQEGYSRVEAAKLGAAEVAWPVTASTLTTVVAFAPLLVWPDMVGKFMGFLPKTVIVVLSASLFVALVINPALCSQLMRIKGKGRIGERASGSFILRTYDRFLRRALSNRIVTLLFVLLLLLSLVSFYRRYGRGMEFFPTSEAPRAFVNIKAPEGTSIERLDAITREVESRIDGLENIKLYVANVGPGTASDPFSQGGGLNTATVSIEFTDFVDRKISSNVTVDRIRELVKDMAGAEITVKAEEHGPPVGEPVNIEVSGEDFDTLAALARDIKDRIRSIPGLVDLKDDYEQARPELRFVVDRNRAKLLGVDTDHVGFFLKTAILGLEVGTFRQGDEEYDIVVRLPRDQRDDPDKIERLYVPALDGRMIPVSSLVEVKYAGGYGSINRKDLDRVITVTGTNEGRLPVEILADCQKRLSDLPLPTGYRITFGGEDEERLKAMAFLSKAFVAALFLIAIVLVTEFDSITTPVIIMASVVFSTIGVLIGLLVLGKPFGIIMTGVGIISLAGVVVNNAIVLLDYVEKLRARGLDCAEALARAGMTRLRPVLLTAITTILGLIPMATGVSYDFRQLRWQLKSESSLWWGQMATSVIFGLAVATVLTLIIVPVMYSVLDQLKTLSGHPWRPKDEKNSVEKAY
ncbi:MAG: efflux RND transporter permease subunit [Planctomycetota bacterium]|jgi:CzcA family heavy metal efflux pump